MRTISIAVLVSVLLFAGCESLEFSDHDSSVETDGGTGSCENVGCAQFDGVRVAPKVGIGANSQAITRAFVSRTVTLSGLAGASATGAHSYIVPTGAISSTAATSVLFAFPTDRVETADVVRAIVVGDDVVNLTLSAWHVNQDGGAVPLGDPVTRSSLGLPEAIDIDLPDTQVGDGTFILLQAFATGPGLTVRTVALTSYF